MPKFSTEQRVFIVEESIRCDESLAAVTNMFKTRFGRHASITDQSVLNIVKKWRSTGSVLDLPKI